MAIKKQTLGESEKQQDRDLQRLGKTERHGRGPRVILHSL
jgi:hypothetical protein